MISQILRSRCVGTSHQLEFKGLDIDTFPDDTLETLAPVIAPTV